MSRLACFVSLALLIAGGAGAEGPAQAAQTPEMTLGNGEANWILTDGLERNGSTFVFPEVRIDGDGWLVLHPFRDGKPYGKIYVGAAFLESGTHTNVEVRVPVEPEPGTMFLVMLHSDVNRNREFDFVFVDEHNVLDKAVFEGTKMIAHPFATP